MDTPDLIASIITDDPDIFLEDLLSEGYIKEKTKEGIQRIRGDEDSFLQKLHNNIGTDGLLDLADDLAHDRGMGHKLLLKEMFMWIGVPTASAVVANAMGLPWVVGILFKSAAWLAVVQIVMRFARDVEKKTRPVSDEHAIQ